MELEVRIRKKNKGKTLDVNLRVHGGILALLGDADSGTEEVLRCILGKDRPDEGRIALGESVWFDSLSGRRIPPGKRGAGYLSPERSMRAGLKSGLQARKTLAQNLQRDLPKSFRTKKPALQDQAAQLLKEYGLDGLGGLYPRECSRGQRILAGFAGVMASRPNVILLDHIFDGLDAFTKAELIRKIRGKIRESGVTAILATSSEAECCAFADEIAALSHDSAQPQKIREDFFAHPETVEEAALSGCENITTVRHLNATHLSADAWRLVLCRRTASAKRACAGALPAGEMEAMDSAGFGISKTGGSTQVISPAVPGDPSRTQKTPWVRLEDTAAAIGIRAGDFRLTGPSDQQRAGAPGKDAQVSSVYSFSLYDTEISMEGEFFVLRFRPLSGAELLTARFPVSMVTKKELEEAKRLRVPEDKILILKRG